MRLQDLKEARHISHLHPIVRKIKEVVDKDANETTIGFHPLDFFEIPRGEERIVVQDLIRTFGPPMGGDVKWELGPLEDVLPHKTWGVDSPNRLYAIDIG